MKLTTYLTEAGERHLTLDEAFERIQVECKDAFQAYRNDHKLFRGSPTQGVAKYYGGREDRMSANTDNYVTLAVDNSPKWRKYPKRSKSFICTTDEYYSRGYGTAHAVFAKDGVRYGVAPESDFWWSFDNTFDGSMNTLNFEISEAIKYRVNLRGKYIQNPKTYRELKMIFDEFDKVWPTMHISPDTYKRNPLLSQYTGNMMDTLRKILDPNKNGFKITNSMMKVPIGKHEVWTEGPIYMVEATEASTWFRAYEEEVKPASQKEQELEDYRKWLFGEDDK